MAHEISVNSLGRTEAIFGYGEAPWWDSKDYPAIVVDRAISFDEVFSIAFPWVADMEQLQYADGAFSSQYGIRRSDTKAELGVHSGDYGIIQPKDLFNFCASFFQAYPEIPIASAIAMQGGKVLNLSAQIGEIDILGSGDIHRAYLSFVNSFNGRIKAQVYKSYIRPVCMNTTVAGVSTADFNMVYKHTKHVGERIAKDSKKASQLMRAQFATDEQVQNVLETLAKRYLTHSSYLTVLDDLFPGDSTRANNVKGIVTDLFADNDGGKFPEWKGTAYALFNAVTNYSDHESIVRHTAGRDQFSEGQIRAESSVIGAGAAFKTEALERILLLTNGLEETVQVAVVSDIAKAELSILDNILDNMGAN